MEPKTRANSARIMTATVNCVGVRFRSDRVISGGQEDAEHRHAGPEHPHQHGAAHDPSGEPAWRLAGLQRLGGHRPQRELGEQIAAGGHHDAAES